MISDSLRIALISETLEACSPQRRRAARILLDLWRADSVLGSVDGHLAAIREEAGAAVAAEAHSLLERLGVTGPDDYRPLPPMEERAAG